MKNILSGLLAVALMATLSSYANAQSKVKLCFQTGTSVQSCQDVTAANPLPTTATLSLAAALNVTVTNNAAVPVIVSSANGFGSGTGNVTVTNTAAIPVIVSSPNGFGGAGSSVTVTSGTITEVNSTAILAAATSAIPAGTNAIGTVTVTNTVATTSSLTTTGGWTPLLLNNLLTTVNAVKTSGGKLGKLFCYNPNASVAYVQVWNLTTGAVTVGTTTPLNSYGIPATNSAGFIMPVVGDQYGTGISVAATTTATGGTPPGTGLVCNASYN